MYGKKEIDMAIRRVLNTINGIHKSIILCGNISSYSTNKKLDIVFRKKKLLLAYYINSAEIIIYDEIEYFNSCFTFIFPNAFILIGEYDNRIYKLKEYMNYLLTLKIFLKNNSHLSIGIWYQKISKLDYFANNAL